MRTLDEPIPDEEELFRSVDEEHRDGTCLLPIAIDLPASSVNRSKYAAEPRLVLRGGHSVVAAITPAQLPGPMNSPGNVEHRFVAADAPEEGEAHAEVRVLRTGHAYDKDYKVSSKPFKLSLRRALASRFRVIVPP